MFEKGSKTEWLESEKKALETSLPEIISTFFVVAELSANWHRERAEEERQRAQREEALRLQEQKRKLEERRWRHNIIQAMKSHKLLDGLGENIYEDLHRLRKLRNRVHIRFDDEPEGVGRDDHQAFREVDVSWSLALCSAILKYLAERFPRPEELGVFAHEVSIPK